MFFGILKPLKYPKENADIYMMGKVAFGTKLESSRYKIPMYGNVRRVFDSLNLGNNISPKIDRLLCHLNDADSAAICNEAAVWLLLGQKSSRTDTDPEMDLLSKGGRLMVYKEGVWQEPQSKRGRRLNAKEVERLVDTIGFTGWPSRPNAERSSLLPKESISDNEWEIFKWLLKETEVASVVIRSHLKACPTNCVQRAPGPGSYDMWPHMLYHVRTLARVEEGRYFSFETYSAERRIRASEVPEGKGQHNDIFSPPWKIEEANINCTDFVMVAS